MSAKRIARTVNAAINARAAGHEAKAAKLYEKARQAAVDAVTHFQTFDAENIKALEKLGGYPLDASQSGDPAIAAKNLASLRELFIKLTAALGGEEQPESITTAREDAYQEVMRTVAKYCGVHGKLPTQKALGEFAKARGIKLRVADISATYSLHKKNGGIKFPTLRER